MVCGICSLPMPTGATQKRSSLFQRILIILIMNRTVLRRCSAMQRKFSLIKTRRIFLLAVRKIIISSTHMESPWLNSSGPKDKFRLNFCRMIKSGSIGDKHVDHSGFQNPGSNPLSDQVMLKSSFFPLHIDLKFIILISYNPHIF